MPKVKLITPNLTNSELEYDSDVMFSTIELDTSMTIAQLVGWIDATESTKLVRVDADGNLLTSTKGTASDEIVNSNADILTTATLLVSARATRRDLLVRNVGSDTVYLGADNTVTTSTGFPLDTGSCMTFENFIGTLYGIVATTTSNVRVAEMV